MFRLTVFAFALLAGACGVSAPDTPSPSTQIVEDPAPEPEIVFEIAPIVINGEPPPDPPTATPPKKNQAEAAQRDLRLLQGRWQAVSIEHDGSQERPQGGLHWMIRADRYEVWIGNQNLETNQFTLDPTKRPRTLEMRHVISGSQAPRITGIYELQGNVLKVCYDLTGQGYPKEFTAPQGARRISYVFRRQ
jgi:uncharacterized protein (TIGR03067 family)